MKPKIMGGFVCAMALTLCASALAEQPQKIFRLGYLSTTDRSRESARFGAIRLSLHERGYIEGQNIAFESRYAEGKLDRLAALAAELVALQVDIIVVAGGAIVIRPVMNATKTIPIVMLTGGDDPVEAGLVESLARPGGNVSGITNLSRELGGKRLELLKEAVPRLTRVAVFYEAAVPASVHEVKEILPPAARTLKLTIQPWGVRNADDFGRFFAEMGRQRPDGLYVPFGSLMRDNRRRIAGLASKSRLPSVAVSRQAVEAGDLMSYEADRKDGYRRVAYYVDRILKGAKPADLPVEQPTKFEFIINLKTAKEIGLTIPPNVLARADQVIR
jgi:putative ABC transport system substrate-binding protein